LPFLYLEAAHQQSMQTVNGGHMPKLGPLEIIVILVVVLIIFGPKNLPKLGSAIGKSVRNLREGINSGKKDKNQDEVKAEDVEEIVEDKPSPKAHPEQKDDSDTK
jgi:sec-independent protein translocase protein TatA